MLQAIMVIALLWAAATLPFKMKGWLGGAVMGFAANKILNPAKNLAMKGANVAKGQAVDAAKLAGKKWYHNSDNKLVSGFRGGLGQLNAKKTDVQASLVTKERMNAAEDKDAYFLTKGRHTNYAEQEREKIKQGYMKEFNDAGMGHEGLLHVISSADRSKNPDAGYMIDAAMTNMGGLGKTDKIITAMANNDELGESLRENLLGYQVDDNGAWTKRSKADTDAIFNKEILTNADGMASNSAIRNLVSRIHGTDTAAVADPTKESSNRATALMQAIAIGEKKSGNLKYHKSVDVDKKGNRAFSDDQAEKALAAAGNESQRGEWTKYNFETWIDELSETEPDPTKPGAVRNKRVASGFAEKVLADPEKFQDYLRTHWEHITKSQMEAFQILYENGAMSDDLKKGIQKTADEDNYAKLREKLIAYKFDLPVKTTTASSTPSSNSTPPTEPPLIIYASH